MLSIGNRLNESTKKISAMSLSQILTSFLTMFQNMILVRVLTQASFGTFSQSILVSNLLYAIIGLGLANSIIYFNSSTECIEDRKKKINTIFTLMVIMGIVSIFGLMVFQYTVINFFENKMLYAVIPIVGFRTGLFLLNQGYVQYLIANGFTSIISLRNLLVSIISLLIIYVSTQFTKSIIVILIILVSIDFLQCFYFNFLISKKISKISYTTINLKMVREVFSYSIPLWFTGLSSMLLIYIDKLIIGKLYNVEQFAIYTVASKPIPITFISSTIVVIIMPTLINYYHNNKFDLVIKKWANSIELSFIINCIFGFAIILVSTELINILYTSEYIEGVKVFIIYTINSMLLLTNFGTILLASKNTKSILKYAFLSLILNIILDIVLYITIGFTGPAMATVLTTLFVASIQLIHSSKILKCSINQIVNLRRILLELFIMLILFIAFFILKETIFIKMEISNLYKVLLMIPMFGLVNILIFGNRIRILLKELD